MDALSGESGDRAAEWAGAALEGALRLRAPGAQASTPLVRQLAAKVSRELGLDKESAALLDLSARVRDIGLLALPDVIVLSTRTLTPVDWVVMNRHPLIGAELLDGLAGVASAAAIVRAHHERWDGEGYPDGRRQEAIPLLSRVISTCDAFVAIATDRPHRRGIGAEAALERVCRDSGAQFDPHTVEALVAALAETHGSRGAVPSPAAGRVERRGRTRRRAQYAKRDLTGAIAEFDVVPAFAPAHERLLDAIGVDSTTGGELVAAIEIDMGLTLAVLRRAQTVPVEHSIANVADAVAALTRKEVKAAIADLPRAEFPWRTSQLEVLMHRSRVHAQAVMRAADRIARDLELVQRDDLIVAALLHDVGKLVLGRADPGYTDTSESTTTPEDRIREEQRSLGLDHANLGGLLLRRWGLPDGLASTVAAHHVSEAEDALATYVRLADMLVHHAQGETVNRRVMLHLGYLCEMTADALRDVLFDLPHLGGSRRRRADASPLSTRETVVLRILAEGKHYKVIAMELGLATSTVRSHLHNAYTKLGVDDRAQAVLRATEMGWV